MTSVNLGPATTTTVNTQSPYSTGATIQTISVNLTPLSVATVVVAEQSFGLNGVSQATAATGIKAGDVIVGVSPPGLGTACTVCAARVDLTTDDKFYLQFVNPTAGALVPQSGQYLITVLRYNQSTRPTGVSALASLPSTIQ